MPKGVNGADVIQEVVHNGKICGKIIFDAKNRDAWQNAFATKLKADKLAQGADPRHFIQATSFRRTRVKSTAKTASLSPIPCVSGDRRNPPRPARAHAPS